jgi:hypothetical protein
MRGPRNQPDNPGDPEDWSEDEEAPKYEALTMGDEADQDEDKTLAVQSDARETVEPEAPALRTRGRTSRLKNADTREDAGVKLDAPTGDAPEVNPPKPARPTRGSARRAPPKIDKRASQSTRATASKRRAPAQRSSKSRRGR